MRNIIDREFRISIQNLKTISYGQILLSAKSRKFVSLATLQYILNKQKLKLPTGLTRLSFRNQLINQFDITKLQKLDSVFSQLSL